MSRYYFVLCALPPLYLERKPQISYFEMQLLLQLNLSLKDASLVFSFRQFIDFKNLRCLWLKRPFHLGGNLSEKEMTEAIIRQEVFPEYVFSFLKTHEDIPYRLKDFPYLLSQFFKNAMTSNNQFLRRYFTWERDLALILTALRAKQRKRNLASEILYEDPDDFFVGSLLSQKDDKDVLGVPEEFQGVKALFLQHGSDPKALFRAYMEYRLEQMENLAGNEFFTINHLMAYLAKYQVVLEWNESNIEEGKQIVDSLVRGKI
ncbi:MAG: DUF2764 family protein [Chlamydiota bacterium]